MFTISTVISSPSLNNSFGSFIKSFDKLLIWQSQTFQCPKSTNTQKLSTLIIFHLITIQISGFQIISSIIAIAFCAFSSLSAVIIVVQSSLKSMATFVSSIIFLIVSHHFQIMFLTSSGLRLRVYSLGAYADRFSLGLLIVCNIKSSISNLALFHCWIACCKTSIGNHLTFISICNALIQSLLHATLKSISHVKSSCHCKSVRITYPYFCPLISIIFKYLLVFVYSFTSSSVRGWITSPIAIQDTGFLIGTHASISDKQLAHTLAIEVEPFEDKTSETILIV